MKTLLLIATLLSAATAVAEPKTDILGKWTDSETGVTVEYKENGKVDQTLPSGEVLHGKYVFVDETHIFIHVVDDMMPTAPVITPIAVDGDDLQMIGEDGKKVKKLKRQKAVNDGQ